MGSLHCAAMCGPLAFAGTTRGGRANGSDLAGYAFGRLASYATIGAALARLGAHALCRLPVGLAQGVAAGCVAAAALWQAWRALRPAPAAPAAPVRLRRPSPPARFLASLVPRRGLGLGLATGLLPCGMLLPAYGLAAASADARAGALAMAAFWLGSAPGPLAPALGARLFARLRLGGRGRAALWLLLAAWVAVRPLVQRGHVHPTPRGAGGQQVAGSPKSPK